jgi:CO/xanthine dehydrogenase FAD-binding subunit
VRLIDLSTIRSLADLSDGHDALTIGAGVKLEDLRRHTLTSGDNMLLEALDDLANHQIREMATVAGNLLQEKRCSFYRNGFSCYKQGGWTCPCYALLGEHRFHHAVIDAHRCQAVTPSDLATAFLALDADVTVSGRHESRRSVPIGDLYSGPGESVLAPDEILTSVIVPLRARRRQSAFEKLRLYAGDFAICSAAVSLEIDDGMVVDARVALGAIAPTPYRAKRTEQALIGTRLADGSSLDRAANAWAQDAYPLADNGWKVDAACGLIRSALRRFT